MEELFYETFNVKSFAHSVKRVRCTRAHLFFLCLCIYVYITICIGMCI